MGRRGRRGCKFPRRPTESKVVALSQVEWILQPLLCSVQQISAAIRGGQQVTADAPGAVGVVPVDDRFIGLTLLLTGEGAKAQETLHTRALLTRQGQRPRLDQVAVLQLGSGSPGVRPAQKVPAQAVTTVDWCAVRIAVPSHYRKQYFEDAESESPVSACRPRGYHWGPFAHVDWCTLGALGLGCER